MIIRLTSIYAKRNVYINMDNVEYIIRTDEHVVEETPEYIYDKLRGGEE